MTTPKLLRRFLHGAQGLVPSVSHGVTVLAYHLVAGGTSSPVDLPAETFHRHLEELRTRARVKALPTALHDLTSKVQDESGTAPVVAVTFDDAYENFYTRAWPLLREAGIPATLFVPVGWIEGTEGPPLTASHGLGPVSWSQLREMVASGLVHVGSHSWSHRDLRRLPSRELQAELRRSREVLEDRLGVDVDTFCYPRGLWSRSVEPQVGQVYEYAAVGGGRQLTAQNLRPLRLWRVPLRREMPPSLAPVLRSSWWWEEWLADKTRRYLRPPRTLGSH